MYLIFILFDNQQNKLFLNMFDNLFNNLFILNK